MKRTILEKFHDNPISGHVGINKTSELISRRFSWEKLIKCQKVKAIQRKSAGLLYPNTIPESPWEIIFMDLITHLPKSPNGNDSIFVVVDRLTKYVHCIACRENIESKQLAQLFFEQVVRLHGLPTVIIGIRVSLQIFCGNLWE